MDGKKTGGRQKGTPNKATAEIRTLALAYGPDALAELAKLSGVTKDDAGVAVAGASSEAARISALGMMLERAYGRAVAGRPIQVNLPDTSTLEGVTKAVSVLVQSAATGSITPGEASDLCGMLDVQRRTIELSDIETRLAKLEAAQGARA